MLIEGCYNLKEMTEIANIHAHKVISDAFFKFHEITLIYNYEIQKLILFRF
jgi:hypothetical protein